MKNPLIRALQDFVKMYWVWAKPMEDKKRKLKTSSTHNQNTTHGGLSEEMVNNRALHFTQSTSRLRRLKTGV